MGAAESSCFPALNRGVDHAGEGPCPGLHEEWRRNGTGVITQALHGQVRAGLWHTGSRYLGCLNPREAGLFMPWATSVPGLPALQHQSSSQLGSSQLLRCFLMAANSVGAKIGNVTLIEMENRLVIVWGGAKEREGRGF